MPDSMGSAVVTGTMTSPTPSAAGATSTKPLPDAYTTIFQMLQIYGLESLASKVLTYAQDGYSSDQIAIELQQTPEWKTRFAANDIRVKNGMSALSPAEYIATERAYRQIMMESGVPSGFYDQTSDFTKFLAEDISPAEIKGRITQATDLINQGDPAQVAYFRQFYTTGDMIAYALDPKRAAPLVGRAFQASQIGGDAASQGLQIGQQTAEQLAAAGITDSQARQGFGQLGQQRATIDKLAGISQQQISADTLARAAFLNDATAAQQVNRLGQAEQGRFGGTSAITTGSLSKQQGGL